MINALRHQRLVHRYEIERHPQAGGDQRLTASKVSTPELIEETNPDVPSDQRLTASKVSTLFTLLESASAYYRLINALRHQRLVH